jgi:hypothetical protein
MTLECGWAHGETELVDLDLYDAHSQHRRMPALHLSFYARRDRLQEVTGMKGHELLREEYDMCCRKPDNLFPEGVVYQERRERHVNG